MGKFEELYAQKSKTAAVIAGGFKSGWTCCADIGMGAPSLLMGMLGKRLEVERRFNLKIHTILDIHPTAIYGDEINTRVGVSWFSGPWARKAVARGTGDVMPCYYRDMPRLFTQEIPVNAFMATVSPMDRHGYFSMGAVGSNGEALLQKAYCKRPSIFIWRLIPVCPGWPRLPWCIFPRWTHCVKVAFPSRRLR